MQETVETRGGCSDAQRREATLVLQAHVSSKGSMTVSSNAPVLFHRRDLDKFEKMLVLGKISTLAQKKQDFWSTPRRQDHRDTSELGGASKKGRMTGADLQDHKDASELGGASKKGRMTGADLEEHRALLAQGHAEKHKLMMQLANGKEGQKNFWECSESRNSTAVLYRFRADNELSIDGVRKFENYLLNDENGFVPDKLTQKGKEARDAMKRTRVQADRDKDSRERKKKRQGK